MVRNPQITKHARGLPIPKIGEKKPAKGGATGIFLPKIGEAVDRGRAFLRGFSRNYEDAVLARYFAPAAVRVVTWSLR